MKKSVLYDLFVFLITGLSFVSCSGDKQFSLTSPDGSLIFHLKAAGPENNVRYSIEFYGRTVVHQSALGFEFSDSTIASKMQSIEKVESKSVNNYWKPVYGERNEYADIYNEAIISFKNNDIYRLRIRSYDEGVAFRYEFIDPEREIIILGENTEFNLDAEATAWVSSRAQSEISKIQVSAIEEAKDRPMLIQLQDSLFIAIGEAALVDFARIKFIGKSPGSAVLKAQLDGEVSCNGKFNTPWRFVMTGHEPGELLENNFLILNLNEPNRIKNTSWIKPGKVIREVTLTTQGGMACVDFAVKHNLQFVEFDAGWYGNEYDDASDATTVTVDPKRSKGPLDLPKVIAYAKSKDIGVILYVNRRALEKQLDEVLPLLKSWGVSGIKYGFVNVGPQNWTSWLHDAVRKAADHELMIDIHDEYRPTGYSRTYPNLMTQEGIRGDEESPPNDMVINTIFTRMIAGAGDHTNCYFAPRVTEKMGSHVSQMAKTICVYSPWQFLFWYDRPAGSPSRKGGAGNSQGTILDIPDLDFYAQVPTVWDDTKVLGGYPGKFAIIARKTGNDWFVGAISGSEEKEIEISYDFLDENRSYEATIYFHDENSSSFTKVGIRKQMLKADDKTLHHLLKQNGLAIHLKAL
jgi:alpha-glucosidase